MKQDLQQIPVNKIDVGRTENAVIAEAVDLVMRRIEDNALANAMEA